MDLVVLGNDRYRAGMTRDCSAGMEGGTGIDQRGLQTHHSLATKLLSKQSYAHPPAGVQIIYARWYTARFRQAKHPGAGLSSWKVGGGFWWYSKSTFGVVSVQRLFPTSCVYGVESEEYRKRQASEPCLRPIDGCDCDCAQSKSIARYWYSGASLPRSFVLRIAWISIACEV
jgi:hypothetical protein